MRRAAGRLLAVVAVAAAMATAGCSQLGGLAPVSGGPITTLRIAANDVLLANEVEILVAPECTESGDDYTCSGTTIEGEPISVTATGSDALTMTVTVGSTVLYQGETKAVIEQFAEVPR